MNWEVIFEEREYFDLTVTEHGGVEEFRNEILRELKEDDPNCIFIFGWSRTHQKKEFWSDFSKRELKRKLLIQLIEQPAEEELWI